MKRSMLVTLAMLALGTPLFAQVNLAGTYMGRVHEDAQERSLGPDLVDYLGLPLNDEGRARALRYSQSQLSLPERQCIPYAPNYLFGRPGGPSIWSDLDVATGRVTAWNISGLSDVGVIKIWMGGEAHPSQNARHPIGGFTTGVWEGNTLTTYTTHFKEGFLRRNGVPLSDKATITMHLTRHGNLLTVTGIIDDRVYLTRPHVVSRTYELNPNASATNIATGYESVCTPEAEVATLKGDGAVPNYLPGENPFLDEMARRYNLPREAMLGGEVTMYPEYRKKMKDTYVAPVMCIRYCCGWDGGFPALAPGVRCITDGTGKPTGP